MNNQTFIPMGLPICPITQMPIQNPVIDHEGNTYENDAIREWIKHNNISPITRNVLEEHNLVPNRALIDTIEKMNTNINNNRNHKIIINCSNCGKIMTLSEKYKGKKNPTCFNCRPWNCNLCTFLNESTNTKCSMCENSR